jgi:response regulator RpfG family c-di-GMP phosphodiesterase
MVLMSIACIIEQDAQTVLQIETALKEIDNRLNVLVFSDLEGFYKWFNELIQINDPDVKTEDLKLLIGDIKFLGPNYFSLIEKVRKLMVRRGILKAEEDLAILLTAFDSPDLNHKQIESRIITNLLFKPFDLPILKQHLQIALANQKAISDFVVFSQTLNTTAEMLKDVQLEAFTELGFTTRSNRELKINDISKYYGEHFDANGKSSLLAKCISCRPHPTTPNEFETAFRYTGLSNAQIKKLRKSLFSIELGHKEKLSISKNLIPRAAKKNSVPVQTINFMVFLNANGDFSVELKDAIEQNLLNVTVNINRNMAAFTEALAKNDLTVLGPKPIHALILSIDYFSSSHGAETWTKIQTQIEDSNRNMKTPNPRPKVFLTSSHEVSDEQLRALAGLIEDVIYTPIDRPYLNKRLVTLFPEIQPRQEAIEILKSETNEVIRVANPIELTSISEACMTMKYYRPISFHSFRRVCLPSPNGGETFELLATCYFNEKKDDIYINHFVFFGITDKYLKYIRKWILERYIASKDSAA